MAVMAVHNEADALDIVQDAMMKLAMNYAERNPDEWKPLFYRILENCITDWHRKETRRKRWFSWSKPAQDDEDQEQEPEEEIADLDDSPEHVIAEQQLTDDILGVIEALPVQQQQCFLLRSWEGLSVKETAEAMNISEGSVKTHLARAMQKLEQVIHEKA